MVDFVLGFVTKVFRWFVAVWIVLDVIVSTIYGGVIASKIDDDYIFWGVLLGFVFGAVTSILTGGLLATFIKIEMNTAKTLKYVSGGKEDDDLPVDVDDDDDDVYANAAPSYSAPSYGAPAPYVEARPPKAYVIPAGTVSIGNEEFKGRSDLTSITIPDGVTSIGKSAFSGCTGLTEVTIPDSVTVIGEMAFQDCVGLTDVTIGGGVTSIGSGAFSFCKRLANVTSMAEVPPVMSAGVFQNVPANVCLYVPAASVDVYRAANTWKKFVSINP